MGELDIGVELILVEWHLDAGLEGILEHPHLPKAPVHRSDGRDGVTHLDPFGAPKADGGELGTVYRVGVSRRLKPLPIQEPHKARCTQAERGNGNADLVHFAPPCWRRGLMIFDQMNQPI
ncbi:hypothetical protein D3C71_1605090 [compost metagenome]